MQIHASCVARDYNGSRVALILSGPPKSGKSDMALRLIGLGFVLIADDRVDIDDGLASAPPSLAGLLEVRGLGIITMPFWEHAVIKLSIQLKPNVERMPEQAYDRILNIPVIDLDPAVPSAAEKARLALECVLDTTRCRAGAFA
jgi:HPr kinase/phosphorylase